MIEITELLLTAWEIHAREYLVPGHEQTWAVRQLQLIEEVRRLRRGLTYRTPTNPANETELCGLCGNVLEGHACSSTGGVR